LKYPQFDMEEDVLCFKYTFFSREQDKEQCCNRCVTDTGVSKIMIMNTITA